MFHICGTGWADLREHYKVYSSRHSSLDSTFTDSTGTTECAFLSCFFHPFLLLNPFPHTKHLKLGLSSCTSRCCRRSDDLANGLAHLGHSKGRSPLWIRSCARRLEASD